MKTLLFLLFAIFLHDTVLGKSFTLDSPDKKNRIIVNVDTNISWSILRDGNMLIKSSPLSMSLNNGATLGNLPRISNSFENSIRGSITAVVPVKNRLIANNYNELKITFLGGYSIEFRAYDEGVAYHFTTELGDKSIEINDEKVTFNFTDNCALYLPKEDNQELQSHYEAIFQKTNVADVPKGSYGYLPLYLSTTNGTKLVITEADLHDYPNLFLYGTSGYSLTGRFPKVILDSKLKDNSDRADTILKKAFYHAKTNGNRSFPWRVVIISADDKGLLENELVYKLSKSNVLKDTSWIKPGKVAWDWWNDNNIYGVNFKSGINTETYKYYVDFASDYGLDYIILDEGWSRSTTDLLAANPSLDLQQLINYATSKQVGIILWALWKPLDQNMDAILDQYVKWGIKGIKVDFMARADQYMVNFYERTARATADRKLLLDMHGAFKPVGLNRTYPNLVNYEGVKGMENNKWEETITPVHNTTLPFTRMVAGPMDFTPGALSNSNKDEFHISFHSPISRGTRAHQAAMYVLYDSPLQMFCDSPSNYRREPAYTSYIAKFPTVWDTTIALEGKIGEYVAIARKNGDCWYIGGMTNWEARNFKISLNFLGTQKFNATILKDGVNVDKYASDYQLQSLELQSSDILKMDMAAGGGFTAILIPIK